MDLSTKLLAYFLPLFGIWLMYARRRFRLERDHLRHKTQAIEDGLHEPVSLHPLIDARLCIGCRSCLNACPEQSEHNVLGLINGKVELIGASDCIGHGACKQACPVEAISLVFGTERRGVELPELAPNFETNVAGIFICGELGGMGLIRNAFEQARQAVESIARRAPPERDSRVLDVVVVGAGPAGFAASLAAVEHELRFVTLEQDSLGGAISHYPRRKLTMMHSAELPLHGRIEATQWSKEQLLSFLEHVERRAGLAIHYHERMHDIAAHVRGYVVRTNRGAYLTRNVLLALGRRGTPRKLGVPGEELSKVVYRLLEPEQYRGEKVMVVGGGDSALEAAVSIAEARAQSVHLAYRSAAFNRAKSANRKRLREASEAGLVRVLLNSRLTLIGPRHVTVEQDGAMRRLENDAVVICAGGVPPTPMLAKLGIRFETKYGTA